MTELAHHARALLPLAQRAHVEGRALEARTLVDAALACAGPELELLGACRELSGRVSSVAGDRARSEAEFESAARCYDAANEQLAAARAAASAAFMIYDGGDGEGALARIEAIEGRTEAPPVLETRLFGYRGNIARQAGLYAQASSWYERAFAASDDAAWRATFSMDLGASQLASGAPAAALLTLARASATIAAAPLDTDTRLLVGPLIAHYRALAAFAQGRPSEEVEGGPAILAAQRAWLRDATLGDRARANGRSIARLDEIAEASRRTEHGRLGLRIVRAIAALPADPRAVAIARDGSGFGGPHGAVDLSARAPLARILGALVSLDRALTIDEIVGIAWPGERIAKSAARNRAHVALSTLRSLGLEGVIVRTPGGYRLADRGWQRM